MIPYLVIIALIILIVSMILPEYLSIENYKHSTYGEPKLYSPKLVRRVNNVCCVLAGISAVVLSGTLLMSQT